MTPYLTDDEVAAITTPLTQGAARVKHFEKLGCSPRRKPNGQPLVWRSDWEDNLSGRTGSLKAEDICTTAQPFIGLPGVYFLVFQNEVIYVGQSDNVYRRLDEHRPRIKFDAWHFITVTDRKQRLEVERRYIAALSPKWNNGNDVSDT